MCENTNKMNVTIYADWQIWGEVDAREEVSRRLSDAQDRGFITGFSIPVVASNGPFGLQFLVMEVFADFEFEDLQKPKKEARRILNFIVGDTDVNIRWVERTSL